MLHLAWAPSYAHELPAGHRFPMAKYALLPEQLLREGILEAAGIFEPVPVTDPQILSVHTPLYWDKLKNLSLTAAEVRRTGFPLSAGLIKREIQIAGGTLQACIYAFAQGVSFNAAGGTHHAFTDRGEGFCLLNDQALAARHLLDTRQAKRVLIIDLDVHQGNGTAEIFREEPRVFTFSMHGAHNFPLRKEHSDLDVPLPDKTGDAAYLSLLEQHLPRLLGEFQPDFAFYQAGVDVLATDKLGRLSLTRAGCLARDRYVLNTCREAALPVVVCMGGGYSEKLGDILEAHVNTFRAAAEIYF